MKSDAPTPSLPAALPHTGTQLSRSAGLVFVLAFLAAAAGIIVIYFFAPEQEAMAALVIATSSAAVFGIWSVLLAAHACWRGETSRWPAVIFSMLAVLVSVPFALMWNAESYSLATLLGLPVFVPFFILASLTAIHIARWRVRRAEKRALAAAGRGEAWNRRRRWRRGLAWYAGVMALLALTILPWPLFVWCVAAMKYGANSGCWQRQAADWMPNIVRDNTVALLQLPGKEPCNELRRVIILYGLVSESYLLKLLTSADPNDAACAASGLYRRYPKVAADVAEKAASGQTTLAPGTFHTLAAALGRNGEPERILRVLRDPQTHPVFYSEIIANLRSLAPQELIPYLEQVATNNTSVRLRESALYKLGALQSHKEIVRVWLTFHESPDLSLRRLAASQLECILNDDPRSRLEVALAYLEDTDLQVRRAVMCLRMNIPDAQSRLRWTKALLPFLDEQDLCLRRGAVHHLATMLRATLKLKHTPNPRATTGGLAPWLGGQVAEKPGEAGEVETVRAAAKKWLEGEPRIQE